MDEDVEGQGPSGYAWYQLGRMSAENDRHTSQTISTLLHQRRSATTQQTLQAQVQTLAAENARLRQELEAYKVNYNNLRHWADGAEKTLERLGAIRD